MVKETKQRNRDVINILTVLGAAILCACLLASVFLYYYGPTGQYLAGNAMLDPAILEQIHYLDQPAGTGKKVRFSFDHIEFSFPHTHSDQSRLPFSSLDAYQKFYKLVASEKSLQDVNQEIQGYFFKSAPAILTVYMRTKEGSDHEINKVFQVIQFVPEDYFRIQLREKTDGEWAYFYQPGIYRKTIQLFTPAANL